MKIRFLVLALLLVGGATPLTAQHPHARSGHKHGSFKTRPQRPVERLLQHREALQLTMEQVEKLQEIDRRTEERNRPYVQRLVEKHREVKAMFEAQPDLTREQRHAVVKRSMEELRPHVEKIRESDHQAMREVREVLSSEQRSLLRALIKKDSRRDGDHGDSDRRRGHGQ